MSEPVIANAKRQDDASENADGALAWHAIDADDVVRHMDGSRDGLSEAEAAARLERFGRNVLPGHKPVHPILRLLAQFNSALIYFLLAAALAATLLGHLVDAGVIVAVVLVNAIVGFVQEGKAEAALNAIQGLVASRAAVIRQGKRETVAAETLVPGDIILLEAGDRVPADGRLLRARALTIDEALLTGESVTAEKHEEPVAADAQPGDRFSMVYSGTMVATGQATAVVTATGIATRIGRISGMLGEIERLTTPLLQQVNRFARRFTVFVLVAAAALFAFAVLVRQFAWADALIAVVALAVGAIPEGLPAVITITLAIGVQRMAARKAVIRHLPAVETLGATSVICTDKTGTLTRNEMTVRQIFVPGHEIEVSGSGYQPQGALSAGNHDDDIAALAAASAIIRCGLLCNDAELHEGEAGWQVEGDPMEGALVTLAMKAGIDPDHERSEWHRLDEIPFDAAHRYMATLHCGPDDEHVIFIKGAPEAVLGLCGHPELADEWERLIALAAGKGERVLGFAQKVVPTATSRLDMASLAQGSVALGLIGFVDPPREETTQAIAECRSAGIAVKMITGDHAATARAIAQQIGLGEAPVVVTGAEIEKLDDSAFSEVVRQASVFARASPAHKLRIVRALQVDGAIVAMTGDGVNDAPALKQADVGIAMGIKGTEAARQASDMVLLDDNFASIVAAVREGRTVYDNIRKVVSWTLPTNGGESLTIILAILIGFTLPLTATQILWINLVTASTLGLALAFEPPEPGIMERQPRRRDAPLLSPFLLWRVALVSVLFTGSVLLVFFGSLRLGESVETARTMSVNMLIAAEVFYLFNVRFLHRRSFSWRGALGTPAVLAALAVLIAAQLAFTYLPILNTLLDSRPLSAMQLFMVIGLGALLMIVIEIEKLAMRRLGWFSELSA